MLKKNPLAAVLIGLFLISVGLLSWYYIQGANSSIDWKITTHAEAVEFAGHEFQKGPFQFAIPATYYQLSESFSAGPITRHFSRDAIFLSLTWLGICLILVVTTYLSRLWFTGISALFIFMLISLRLSSIGLFGFDDTSSIGSIVLIALFVGPSYAFHSYLKNVSFIARLFTFIGVSAGVVLFSGVEVTQLQEQFTIGIYYSMAVLMLLFLVIVAEEIIFGILYLITKSKGGTSNEKHFAVFSLVYLVFLGLVYGKKAGWIRMELPFFDPYVLLIISALLGLWSVTHKKDFFQNIMSGFLARALYIGIGLAVFSWLALAFSRGNDPIPDGLHYFIIYTHLALGVFFFFYIIINFFEPLRSGLQIYKIVYKPQSFHYITTKLAGLVTIAAFFLISNKQAFLYFRAGEFNFRGEQAELNDQRGLAFQYYREGNVYGHDNHLSNYKIGYQQLQKGKIEEANNKFKRATFRSPSAQAYVNQSSTHGMLNEVTPSIVSLETGLRKFPGNPALLNNLGLIYTDLGKYNQAADYFRQAEETGKWNNANQVNLWKIGLGENPEIKYQEGNLPVKTNILASLIGQGQQANIVFDSSSLYPSYPMHRVTFLINGAWYFADNHVNQQLAKSLETPIEESIYQAGQEALAINEYRVGNVNSTIKRLDGLIYHASENTKAKYLNLLGLICLEEHALDMSLDFLNQAIEYGSEEAKLNKAVVLMEQKEFKTALTWMEALAQSDSSFLPLLENFEVVFSDRNDVSEEQRLARVYYQYENFKPAELFALVQNRNPEFISTLWKKIYKELLHASRLDDLQSYFAIVESNLSKSDYEDYLAIVALEKNLEVSGDHAVARALQLGADSLSAQALFTFANQNTLNAPMILATSHWLNQKGFGSMTYDLLVAAIDINKNHIGLLKAYAFSAIEQRHYDYTQPVLQRLKALMPASEYASFYDRFQEEQTRLKQEDRSWKLQTAF